MVPWVNDVLILLAVSLQTAQQLRDKLDIFKQYKQEIRLSIYPIIIIKLLTHRHRFL